MKLPGSAPDEFLKALELLLVRDIGTGCPWGTQCDAAMSLLRFVASAPRVVSSRRWWGVLARALEAARLRANNGNVRRDATTSLNYAKRVSCLSVLRTLI